MIEKHDALEAKESEQDNFLFSPDELSAPAGIVPEENFLADETGFWKILVVDDEEAVHSVTRLVIGNSLFLGRKVLLLNAYSGEEGRKIIKRHSDIALMLVDVVMETDYAGLDLIRYVREDLNNHVVRLVMRTGQPGFAPEKEVIEQYDLNGYQEKTELTSQKLYTLLYSSLRSYRDISFVIANEKGLEQVIAAAHSFFKLSCLDDFPQLVLKELTTLLNFNGQKFYCVCKTEEKNGHEAVDQYLTWQVLAVSKTGDTLTPLIQERLEEALKENRHVHKQKYSVLFLKTQQQGRDEYHLIYLHDGKGAQNLLTQKLLELFMNNLCAAFENMRLNKEVEETQRELIYRLGEAVESRSKETGNHVRRVAHVSELLALKSGLSEKEAYVIKLASPMHDLGKIAIPDAVLNKAGKLDAAEWEIMKTHAELGYDILKGSNRRILQVAACLAREHHEKWDGTGYPRGIQGAQISLEGRITAVADVYDALSSARVYKPSWPKEKVIAYFEEQAGKQFDPDLVSILLRDMTEFNAIRDLYPDEGIH